MLKMAWSWTLVADEYQIKHPVEIDIKLLVVKGEFYNIFFIC